MHRNESRPRRLHLEALEDRTTPATFMVNTTHDDLTPGDGLFSLRKAINAANATPGRDVIVLPGGPVSVGHSRHRRGCQRDRRLRHHRLRRDPELVSITRSMPSVAIASSMYSAI